MGDNKICNLSFSTKVSWAIIIWRRIGPVREDIALAGLRGCYLFIEGCWMSLIYCSWCVLLDRNCMRLSLSLRVKKYQHFDLFIYGMYKDFAHIYVTLVVRKQKWSL